MPTEPSVPVPGAPLGPRNLNGPGWRRPPTHNMTFSGNGAMGSFSVVQANNQFSRGIIPPNNVPTYRNDRGWAMNNGGSKEQPVGSTPNLRNHQRIDENGLPSRAKFYAPPPTPAESEGQAEQQGAQFKVDQILPTLVRKASQDRLPPRPENSSNKITGQVNDGRRQSPNPMLAMLLQDSIPEPETHRGM